MRKDEFALLGFMCLSKSCGAFVPSGDLENDKEVILTFSRSGKGLLFIQAFPTVGLIFMVEIHNHFLSTKSDFSNKSTHRDQMRTSLIRSDGESQAILDFRSVIQWPEDVPGVTGTGYRARLYRLDSGAGVVEY